MFLGRVVGPSDPQWELRDSELALAHRRVQAEKCNGCGTTKEEWEEDRFAYVAHTWVCPGCENVENERHNDPLKDEGGTPGLKTYLLPRQVSEAVDELVPGEDPVEPGAAGSTDGERI